MRISHRYLFGIIILIGVILISTLVLFVRQSYLTELKEFDIASGSIVSSIFYEESRKVNDKFADIKEIVIEESSELQLDLSAARLQEIVSEIMIDFSVIDSLVKVRMSEKGVYTNYNYQFAITKLRVKSGNDDIVIVGNNEDINELILYDTGNKVDDYSFRNSFYYYQSDNYMEITLRSLFPVKRRALLYAMIDKVIISCILLFAIVLMVILIIKNIIKQKHLLDMKSDFIDNITHEFNTPLSTINLASDILQNDNIDKEKVNINAEIIKRQIVRLRKMIDNAVDLSMFMNKQQMLNREYVSLNSLVDNCVNQYRSEYSDIRFIIEYCAENDMVFVDVFYLKSALNNLIDNTIKYNSGRDVAITINTIRSKESFVIHYRDNGTGISKEDQKHIFNKFYRGRNRSNKDGLGLGLYIVKRAFEAHKGSVILDRTYINGVGFILKIPITNE
jgi:two-component system phosphate regulon sensor histidine kinase PhoR